MTNKTSLGWTITVRQLVLGGGIASIEIFYAAIPDQLEALEAVKKVAGAAADTEVVAHQGMSESLMNALELKAGQLKSFREA